MGRYTTSYNKYERHIQHDAMSTKLIDNVKIPYIYICVYFVWSHWHQQGSN